ncbi:hypothetical protein AXE80_14155 [Wenyingzhuangia fucanilytica]|uniref:Deoxyuridine 5'-triphosphate nucleotidohydrolase n=2 Tax=Wenyingzhuangia fucanilytica TaxID=1790137 RepID=A0A1B1Y9F9_9FLAO|nr:hypothetical protein AXE80_14155 [Wenyingzhuangia fucanilytica]
MQFRLLAVIMLFFMVSCSSKKNVNPEIKIPNIRYSKLVKEYKANSFKEAEFNTVKIGAKMSYKIGNSSQKLGLNFRIAKGEKIWISGDFLGIPVVKMLIEKDSVHYYNKFDKTYFDGSFDFIKQLIGVDVSYAVLEKLFLGDLILNIEKNRFKMDIHDNSYFIYDGGNKNYYIEAAIYPLIFKTKSQLIEHVLGENLFATYYKNYQEVEGFLFPKELNIKGRNKGKESVITIKYNDIKVNENLSFPYKVPKDCDKPVVLKSKENTEDNE